MFKVILVIAVIIGLVWYFQPDTFNHYWDMIRGKDSAPASNTNTLPPLEDNNEVVEDDPEPETGLSQGYCVIDGTCEFVARTQCDTQLFVSRSLCENQFTLEETETTTENYVGRPRDSYNNPYDCNSDTDCDFDNSNCIDNVCQCDYTIGECYII